MRAPGVSLALRALRLRAWAALRLLRTMVVVTARSLAGFLGRPSFLPGPGVRGPPWLLGAG